MLNRELIKELDQIQVLTDRVSKRRKEYFSAIPYLCGERSRLVTNSWKKTENKPIHIRRAKLFKNVMEGLSIRIGEGELIVGSQTKYIRGAGPYVDWRPDIVFELFSGDYLNLQGIKEARIDEKDKKSLLEDANYWKGIAPADRIYDLWQEIFGGKIRDLEKVRAHMGIALQPVVSRCADYEKVLKLGLKGIIKEIEEELEKVSMFNSVSEINKYNLLKGMIITCEAVINFAKRYSILAKELADKETNPSKKEELRIIADNCLRVPANPPRSFYEALQSFWFIHLCVNLESANSLEAPGRMDQYLYPFYERDINNGVLSREQAAELLGCLWVKFNEMEVGHGKVWSEAGQSSQFQDITLGGVTEDGKDASNELTYLMLEVTRQIKMAQPATYIRCHQNTPEWLWRKSFETCRDRGDGQPAFLNDQAVILNLVSKNIPIQEARNWVGQGCVHPFAKGATGDRPINMNLAKIFEIGLNDGVDPISGKMLGISTGDPRKFKTFEELYDAIKRQMEYFFELYAKMHRILWEERISIYSLPFYSSIMPDCIQKGLDFMAGGVRYPQQYYGFHDRGHVNIADSLAAIKKLVYEEKQINMDQLLDALKNNFEGNEVLRHKLLSAPKYGNDTDFVDSIFDDFWLWTERRIAQTKHATGEKPSVIRGGASKHYYHGKGVGALPDGRKAYEPLADGSLSPMRAMDTEGPTAVIKSASKINHTEHATDSLLNMKLSPSMLKNNEGLSKGIALVKTYFNRGGYHIQFNMMGNEILKKAKEKPEKYQDLLVRVAGYSAYFVDLSEMVQDEIIARTEQEM